MTTGKNLDLNKMMQVVHPKDDNASGNALINGGIHT
jgi:hypothetical protein